MSYIPNVFGDPLVKCRDVRPESLNFVQFRAQVLCRCYLLMSVHCYEQVLATGIDVWFDRYVVRHPVFSEAKSSVSFKC